jgi:hypothetical protein
MQRRFVEVLAECGSVRVSAAAVSKTHRAAYQLRNRAEGRWFGIGWDAATMWAQDMTVDRMLEAAVTPTEYVGVRAQGSSRMSWRRTDPALGRGRGMALLTRLDKAVAKIAADGERYRLARLARGNFDAYLALLGRGAALPEWQAFFAEAGSQENDVLYGYLHGFLGNSAANSTAAETEIPHLVPQLARFGFIPRFGPAAGAGLEV